MTKARKIGLVFIVSGSLLLSVLCVLWVRDGLYWGEGRMVANGFEQLPRVGATLKDWRVDGAVKYTLKGGRGVYHFYIAGCMTQDDFKHNSTVYADLNVWADGEGRFSARDSRIFGALGGGGDAEVSGMTSGLWGSVGAVQVMLFYRPGDGRFLAHVFCESNAGG